MRFGAADRVRASKIRARIKEGDELPDDDQAWFDNYEQAKRGHKSKAEIFDRPDPTVDASASERITYTEERSAAQGNHVHPAAYEGMVRAEGLRADTLLRIVADALVRVNDQYASMNAHLLQRTTAIEEAHVAMLHEVREHFLARVNAEAEVTRMQIAQAAAGDGEEGSELAQLLAYVMQAKAQKDAAEATPEGQKAKRKAERERAKKKEKVKPLGDISE